MCVDVCCVLLCVYVCVSAVGQSAKLQQSYTDFLPDYFSMTEKPPEEFCLSPDPSSSSSCSSSQSHISVDLSQKRGEVINPLYIYIYIYIFILNRVCNSLPSFTQSVFVEHLLIDQFSDLSRYEPIADISLSVFMFADMKTGFLQNKQYRNDLQSHDTRL